MLIDFHGHSPNAAFMVIRFKFFCGSHVANLSKFRLSRPRVTSMSQVRKPQRSSPTGMR